MQEQRQSSQNQQNQQHQQLHHQQQQLQQQWLHNILVKAKDIQLKQHPSPFHGSLEVAYREYQQAGRYENAERHCGAQFLCQDTNSSAEAFLLLSATHSQHGHLVKTAQFSTMAIKQKPNIAEAYNNLGNIYRGKGQLQDALAQYQHAVRVKPDFIDGYINLGIALKALGNFEQAIVAYTAALQYDPNLNYVLNDLGNLYSALGRFQEAKKCYMRIIDQCPEFAVAWRNLGCLFETQGDTWLAMVHFDKAVNIDPNLLDAHISLGNTLKKLKFFDRAIVAFQRALNMSPNNAAVYCSLASVYYEKGLVEVAVEMYRRAIELHPISPEIVCNFAKTLKNERKLDEAEYWYFMALQIYPHKADLLFDLANIKFERGDIAAATRLYVETVLMFPEFADAHSQLALVLLWQGKFTQARMHCLKAMRLRPNFFNDYVNMGDILRGLHELAKAVHYYKFAIEINPSFSYAHYNLGNTYKDLGRQAAAVDEYRKALKLKPDFPAAFYRLDECARKICDWSDYDARIKEVVRIALSELEGNACPSLHPLDAYLRPFTPQQRIEVAARYANSVLGDSGIPNKPKFQFDRNYKGRLRIGYAICDFRNHAAPLLMKSIPALHDRERFEIFCYALFPDDKSKFYANFAREVDHFIDLSSITCDWEAAHRIYSDKINILINVDGYPWSRRHQIFALKPAPIQAMWLGYPGTSGSSFMDYLITDAVASPLELAHHYSEKLAHMPHTFYIADYRRMFPHLNDRLIVEGSMRRDVELSDTHAVVNSIDLSPLIKAASTREVLEVIEDEGQIKIDWNVVELPTPQIQFMVATNKNQITVNGVTILNGSCLQKINRKFGRGEEIPKNIILTARQQYSLPENAIVYCNFNRPCKLDPPTLESWIHILKQVPNSYLWLVPFTETAENNIRKFATDLGISNDRLIFSKAASKEEHIRRGQLADICLDTWLYNGHTTTTDSLWAGTPVVTLLGETFMSRIAASILNGLGCPELIARNRQEYENIAIKLGTDRNYLKVIRWKVREARMQSPLFDCRRVAHDLEKLFIRMWEKFSQNEETDHILDII